MQETVTKTKKTKYTIPVFLLIVATVIFSTMIWFNKNQLIVHATLTTGDKMIKELQVLNEDLKNARIAERDSTNKYQELVRQITTEKDSVAAIKEKEKQELNEKIDSLQRILDSFQHGDLEPVKQP